MNVNCFGDSNAYGYDLEVISAGAMTQTVGG